MTGPQGPAGADGKDGEDGVVTTTDGVQGIAGPQGPAGVDGKDGEDGIQGPQGLAGADGTDNKAIASISCVGSFTFIGSVYSYDYRIHRLNSGDVVVSGDISGGDFGVSRTLYFAANQNSAIPTSGFYGQVTITADIFQTNNFGFFRFSIDPNTLIIGMEYYDNELPSYGYLNPSTLSLNTLGTECSNQLH